MENQNADKRTCDTRMVYIKGVTLKFIFFPLISTENSCLMRLCMNKAACHFVDVKKIQTKIFSHVKDHSVKKNT